MGCIGELARFLLAANTDEHCYLSSTETETFLNISKELELSWDLTNLTNKNDQACKLKNNYVTTGELIYSLK